MKVLVLDGGERTSLAITRSLGQKGIEVHCGESYHISTASLSKYCKKSITYPDPQSNCTAFVDHITKILKNEHYDMVFSSREVTTIPLSYYKKDLEKFTKIPFPNYNDILITHDKSRTFKAAIEHGVPAPRTYFVEALEEIEGVAADIDYPVVVKSRRKTAWKDGSPVMEKVTSKNYVSDKSALIKIFRDIYERTGNLPLIQEYIPGKGYGVEVLTSFGEPIAIFMHKRLREYPLSGGASTLRESIYDTKLLEAGLKMVKGIKWHGVAMIEFKLDERDGLPKLMEINGRFWGSLPLSIAAGLDFPYLLFKMMMGDDVNPVLDYQVGVKCRWLIPGDFLWLMSSLKNKPDKYSVMKEFFRFRGIKDDILSWNDPAPTFGALNGVLHQMKDVAAGKRNVSGEVIARK